MIHTAEIDLGALEHNLRVVKARRPNQPLILDARADAYGHGLLPVAEVAKRVGVAALRVTPEPSEFSVSSHRVALPLCYDAVGGIQDDTEFAYGWCAGSRPVMSVRAAVVASKTINPGDGVSYGYTFISQRRTHTALLGLGYGDGMDRHAGNQSSVSLGGADFPIIGRVAMNAAVIDTGDTVVPVGEWATLFGDPAAQEPSIDSWARSVHKAPAEVAISFGLHLPATYRKEG